MISSGKRRGVTAAALALIAAAGLSSTVTYVPQPGTAAKAVTAKSDPAKQQKQTPTDTKSNRLGDGSNYRRTRGAYCGKRVRHTVAQGRRIAAKKRNVKRAKR